MGESISLVDNFKINNVVLNCGTYNDLEKNLIKVLNKKKLITISYIFYKPKNMTMKTIIVMLFILNLMDINLCLWEMQE